MVATGQTKVVKGTRPLYAPRSKFVKSLVIQRPWPWSTWHDRNPMSEVCFCFLILVKSMAQAENHHVPWLKNHETSIGHQLFMLGQSTYMTQMQRIHANPTRFFGGIDGECGIHRQTINQPSKSISHCTRWYKSYKNHHFYGEIPTIYFYCLPVN